MSDDAHHKGQGRTGICTWNRLIPGALSASNSNSVHLGVFSLEMPMTRISKGLPLTVSYGIDRAEQCPVLTGVQARSPLAGKAFRHAVE